MLASGTKTKKLRDRTAQVDDKVFSVVGGGLLQARLFPEWPTGGRNGRAVLDRRRRLHPDEDEDDGDDLDGEHRDERSVPANASL